MEKPHKMSDERFERLQGAVNQENKIQKAIDESKKHLDYLEYQKEQVHKIVDVYLSDIEDEQAGVKVSELSIEGIMKRAEITGDNKPILEVLNLLAESIKNKKDVPSEG